MTNTMIQIKDLQQNHQMTELSSAEEMMVNGGILGAAYDILNDFYTGVKHGLAD